MLINKKCDSHQQCLASKCECVNVGSPNCEPADAANPQGNCRGAGECKNWGEQENRIGPSCSAYERKEFREPRGLIFPYIDAKFLNLIPDLDIQTGCSLSCKKLDIA